MFHLDKAEQSAIFLLDGRTQSLVPPTSNKENYLVDVDLSQFDDIADRVARAKAKSEAVRKSKSGESSGDSPPGMSTQPTAEESVSKTDEAASGKTAVTGLQILEFILGTHFKLKGRAGRVIGTRYDLVSFVYDDDPGQTVTADRYRLSNAYAEGALEFAPKSEAYRPDRINKTDRIDYHEYVWLDTRKGMTAKKKRPRSIAIINPDYCTGCDACIEVCPTDCIEEVDVADAGLDGIGSFCEVRLSDCIGCVQCVHICPWEAIDMVGTDKAEAAYGLPAGSL